MSKAGCSLISKYMIMNATASKVAGPPAAPSGAKTSDDGMAASRNRYTESSAAASDLGSAPSSAEPCAAGLSCALDFSRMVIVAQISTAGPPADDPASSRSWPAARSGVQALPLQWQPGRGPARDPGSDAAAGGLPEHRRSAGYIVPRWSAGP